MCITVSILTDQCHVSLNRDITSFNMPQKARPLKIFLFTAGCIYYSHFTERLNGRSCLAYIRGQISARKNFAAPENEAFHANSYLPMTAHEIYMN